MTNEFDVIEQPMVALWLKDQARSNPLGFISLTGNNVQRFHKNLGKPHGTTQRFQFWKQDYLGFIIFIYCDNESTYYKIQYLGTKDIFVKDKKVAAYITGYLNSLIQETLS